MPNTPAQFPNFDLPGAEWFGLSPNAQIAIQGRRRASFNTGLVALPPVGIALTLTQTIETGFTNTSGIYVHHFMLSIGGTGAGLRVDGLLAGFTLTASNYIDYPIGVPVLSLQSPGITQPILAERDLLITAKDLLGAQLTFGAPLPGTGNLIATALVGIGNPSSVSINVGLVLTIVWTRLDGFTE